MRLYLRPLILLTAVFAAAAAPATAQLRRPRAHPAPTRATTVRHAPPPRVTPRHRHDAGCRQWVPPVHRTVTERVWVPERREREWVPPAFELVRDACGRWREVQIRAGHWRTVRHPGYWDCRTRQVCVTPGRWQIACAYR